MAQEPCAGCDNVVALRENCIHGGCIYCRSAVCPFCDPKALINRLDVRPDEADDLRLDDPS